MNLKELIAKSLIRNITLMGYKHPPAAAHASWEVTKLKPKMVLRMEDRTGILIVTPDIWKRLLEEGILSRLGTEDPGSLKLRECDVWVYIDHETKDTGVCLLTEPKD
jgi:hypothetical protein